MWLLLFITIIKAQAYSFNELMDQISSHVEVSALSEKVHVLDHKANKAKSWGDPMVKLAAKNFPKDSLKDDETPMTGIELGFSQKISMTNKYGDMGRSFKALSDRAQFEKEQLQRKLRKIAWQLIIEKEQLSKDQKIIEENLEWMKKMLAVSKKLYSNGKIGQQGLLDIQIRKSELESLLEELIFDQNEKDYALHYLVDSSSTNLKLSTVPWKTLEKSTSKLIDPKELGIQKEMESKEFLLKAKKKNIVPDITFSIGYTKRSNIDQRGDFLSASISFPLPFSSERHSDLRSVVHERDQAKKNYLSYQKKKASQIQINNNAIEKTKKELQYLLNKTIIFAKNSREIASKSYRVGKVSYLELLNAEIKFQQLQMKKNKLEAKLRNFYLHKLYLEGAPLYE